MQIKGAPLISSRVPAFLPSDQGQCHIEHGRGKFAPPVQASGERKDKDQELTFNRHPVFPGRLQSELWDRSR